ncbi:MAG: magnesium transporter [Acidobacteriota bacterium]
MSVWKAAALSIAELGVAVFFVGGVTTAFRGASGPWFVLAACAIGAYVRAIDIESWALLIPGGLVSRVRLAFGPRLAGFAASAVLAERLVLGALAALLVGHYVSAATVSALGGSRLVINLTAEELATFLSAVIIGLLWLRARAGLDYSAAVLARVVWGGIALVAVLAVWGVLVARGHGTHLPPISPPSSALWYLGGLALALPSIGGGEALATAAHEFAPPRIESLKRAGVVVAVFAFAAAVPAFVYRSLVPATEYAFWIDTPLAGLAQHLGRSSWVRALGGLAALAAAAALLVPAAHAALEEAVRHVRRLASERALPQVLSRRHPRFGTFARATDVAMAVAVALIVSVGGRVEWLGRAYAVCIAVSALLKIVALVRLRASRADPRPYIAPFNVRVGGRELPVGLVVTGALIASAAGAALVSRDVPSIAALAGIAALALMLGLRGSSGRETEDSNESLALLPPAEELSLDQMNARPGNVLVPVRNPYALQHVAAALQSAGDRDAVVMTVRLIGSDVEEGTVGEAPTPYERNLLSQVLALAERYHRSVKLLIVPGRNVFDAVIATVAMLRSSEVYVGESASLSADEQARLLGDAWERASKPEGLNVRLVVFHHSGRSDTYYLGAHPPAFRPADLDLIHRLWLDTTRSVGPHVHHHDIVRAALTQMEKQLGGPQREDALAVVRQVARPADDLAAAVRERDYSRLRDMTRNRHASDLAALLTDLKVEDQVVVFRVLPRKDAAAVFEYLSRESQETLLKAMAQEDVAALLNDMAPDDRTMFLEELPAAATRRLLALLTPTERAVALTLLGYPERSVGRLMTPQYVSVQEHWTIEEVLDHIRTHGQDSETLNVIYVVDDQGLLIDDIRIRELLLTPLDKRISDLMDRRFVALKATDDEQTAVAAFRQYDRTALPVTDTAGMLIGIVTIDDVLDVAEATATKDIQRIGGSEAFDEPYTQIAFGRMIQKRAGWLTALFLGEMLTATAMGAFEAEISKAVVLALFVPLIISSGGNSGSQASTLVIRALALGEVGLADWWRVIRREVLAGLALGSILGIIGFLRISIWSAFSTIYGEHWLLVAITVGVALIGIVLWGTLVGSFLPFLLRRLGFDPATSSAPFVATLVDVTGLVIYFSVALVILHGTLL